MSCVISALTSSRHCLIGIPKSDALPLTTHSGVFSEAIFTRHACLGQYRALFVPGTDVIRAANHVSGVDDSDLDFQTSSTVTRKIVTRATPVNTIPSPSMKAREECALRAAGPAR
jgi:hypothetical protein